MDFGRSSFVTAADPRILLIYRLCGTVFLDNGFGWGYMQEGMMSSAGIRGDAEEI